MHCGCGVICLQRVHLWNVQIAVNPFRIEVSVPVLVRKCQKIFILLNIKNISNIEDPDPDPT